MKKWSVYLFVLFSFLAVSAAGCGRHSAIPDQGLTSDAAIDADTSKQSGNERDGKDEASSMDDRMDDDVSGAKTELEPAYFDFDSWVLTSDAREVIQRNYQWLKVRSGKRVLVEGHTDERGSDAYNLALGEKRARSVMLYLETLGLDRERISIISYGEERPADSGHSEESWAKNRRAEFVVR
jgi:peptidoglycan-associated lipoprotein